LNEFNIVYNIHLLSESQHVNLLADQTLRDHPGTVINSCHR